MKSPALKIYCSKIFENTQILSKLASQRNVELWGVTKGLCGAPELGRIFIDGGCTGIADSRLDNIRKLAESGLKAKFLLIRIPMQSEISDVVELTDSTLVSDMSTILMLEQECKLRKKNYSVILMIEAGDLREGVMEDALIKMKAGIRSLDRVKIIGIGTNLGCFGGILPSLENMSFLVKCKKTVEEITGYSLEKISVGGTTSVPMLYDGSLPDEINHLRAGSAMLRGAIAWRPFAWLKQDAFEFCAEWVEIARKPSKPWGAVELDAFGKTPHFDDIGPRLRGILAAGRQDIYPEGLRPCDHRLKILGASSDHLVCDVDETKNKPKIGDSAVFHVNYAAIMTAATSPYVKKIFM